MRMEWTISNNTGEKCQVSPIPNRNTNFSIKKKKLRIFLDGAHTMESLSVCIDWFKENASQRNASKKLLLFNATGDRDIKKMLELLNSRFPFDKALFSTNIFSKAVNLTGLNLKSICFLIKMKFRLCLQTQTFLQKVKINAN